MIIASGVDIKKYSLRSVWRNDHRLQKECMCRHQVERSGGGTNACKKDARVDIKNYPFQATRLSDSHSVSVTGSESGMQWD